MANSLRARKPSEHHFLVFVIVDQISQERHLRFLITIYTLKEVHFVSVLLHAGDSQIERFLAICEEGILDELTSAVKMLASDELFACIFMIFPSRLLAGLAAVQFVFNYHASGINATNASCAVLLGILATVGAGLG